MRHLDGYMAHALLVGLVLSLLSPLVTSAESPTPIVVIISMDGIRHDYPDNAQLGGLQRMIREGARVQRLTPVYPSNTFPGHISLATGAHPDVHGIVDNFFADRDKGIYFMSPDMSWLEAEPLWITAERQGVAAATYFWVGSEQDWRSQGTRYRIAPFDGERPEAAKVEQILAWLALPAAEQPGLIMSYWRGTDRVAHRWGPNSARTYTGLAEQDQHLTTLLEGIDALDLWDRLTLMVVSDHGMSPMGDYVDLQSKLDAAKVSAKVTGYTIGHVFLDDPSQHDAAIQALANIEHTTVITAEQARESYNFMHPNRGGDLVVLAEPPVIFARPGGFEGFSMGLMRFFGWDFGGHGYDPGLPDMGAVWLLKGRGITPGTSLERAHQIDVAPTAAALLNIDPPQQASGVNRLPIVPGGT